MQSGEVDSAFSSGAPQQKCRTRNRFCCNRLRSRLASHPITIAGITLISVVAGGHSVGSIEVRCLRAAAISEQPAGSPA
jgi:hypothetical protein